MAQSSKSRRVVVLVVLVVLVAVATVAVATVAVATVAVATVAQTDRNTQAEPTQKGRGRMLCFILLTA
jgi:flagellar basal body-associated protein FliL